MTQEHFDKLRKACLDNAEAFLKAANKLTDAKSRHISYHLAGLALEEIGKIEMLGMQAVVDPRRSEDDRIKFDVEDHERKLFWAFWGVSFGKELLTKEQIQSSQGLAKSIHAKRLSSLYVDVQSPMTPGKAISKGELDNIVKLAEARLGMERASGVMRLDGTQFTEHEKKVLDWFLKASSDPLERKFMFGGVSNAKLVELGDAKKWVNWLYDEAMKRQDEAQKAFAEELKRQQPTGKEVFEPKWSMKIKIRTNSHSVRQKPLDSWNAFSKHIKLYKGKEKHDMIVELIMPKNVPLQGVWDMGWNMSKLFITAINVGTSGFFWWNVPIDTFKFYDEVKDLERPGFAVALQLAKKLEVNWQDLHLVLDDQALNKSALVYSFMASVQAKKEVTAAFLRYTSALALLAKSDVHLRFEPNIWLEFYSALKDAAKALGDQKQGENIADALRRIIPSEIHQSLERCFEIEKTFNESEGKPPKIEITLTDVFSAKMLFDYYIIKKAQAWAEQRAKRGKQAQKNS